MISPMVGRLETINPVHFVRIAEILQKFSPCCSALQLALHYGEVRRIMYCWSGV